MWSSAFTLRKTVSREENIKGTRKKMEHLGSEVPKGMWWGGARAHEKAFYQIPYSFIMSKH